MSTRNILVVDDAVTIRMYHRKLMSGSGWAVDEASNGVEALERIAQRSPQPPYDLSLSDINMPHMDGYAFVRALRGLDPSVQAPVVMVSTEAQAHDAEAAFAAGANAYMVKPARPNELVLTVALLLGEQDAARSAVKELARGRKA